MANETIKLPIIVLGAGSAGLITAYTLLRDGFENVQLVTRDRVPGGVWSEERVYPGLTINNVHGEFRFSPLEMPPPLEAHKTGGRLIGRDMQRYMQAFSDKFLTGRIRFSTEVLSIHRDATQPLPWLVNVLNEDYSRETLKCSKLVLCTGGCSTPHIPTFLSPETAVKEKYGGLVFHSQDFAERREEVLASVPDAADKEDSGSIVVVGGGKSAQDISSDLAAHGKRVTVVFQTADAFLASPIPLPTIIRKSRFLPILSPTIDLNSRLERFLHTTRLGSAIVHFLWSTITAISFWSQGVPKDSPLRNAHTLFWSIRTNDEGAPRSNGFHSLVNAGKIKLVAPASVTGFTSNGSGVTLNNGNTLVADAVILATGYRSSWDGLFDDETADSLGIRRQPPTIPTEALDEWPYPCLRNPPATHPESQQWAASIYCGLVPAKNILRRDFAINGAVFSANNGYTHEVSAHWISSYFIGDKMRLPKTPEEAIAQAERNARWMRKRHPDQLLWVNESYSSSLNFWTWPQYADSLLEDMGLANHRSGGNWFTWIFKIINLSEIANLAQERALNRVENRDSDAP